MEVKGNVEDDAPVYRTIDEFLTLKGDDNLLVGGFVSPASGQVCRRDTDLVAFGAQNIFINRTYIPPIISSMNSRKRTRDYDMYRLGLYRHLNQTYKGWNVVPHRHLHTTGWRSSLRLIDRSGIHYDFGIAADDTYKLSGKPYGITNCCGETASGKFDPRNISIPYLSDYKTIFVTLPDGAKQHYTYNGKIHVLDKEVLPNGKILKYSYQDSELVRIDSMDPLERYVYATIQFEGSPLNKFCRLTSHHQLSAEYRYFTRSEKVIYINDNGKKKREIITSPPLLSQVTSPYHDEEMTYSDCFVLTADKQSQTSFTCSYGAFEYHMRVNALLLPSGSDGTYVPVYELSYQPVKPGERAGWTKVKCCDGSITEYHYSASALPSQILSYAPDGTQLKQELYQWTDNQWLASTSSLDGNGNLFYRKSFEYDFFGNPTLTLIEGDLTGDGVTRQTAIKKSFSQDGFNLVLHEEKDNGKIVTLKYLPNTNLVTVKLTKHLDRILKREFFQYDDANNLICKIVDDGVAEHSDDLTNVTQRITKRYRLYQTSPHLHMPEWEEHYYLEDGEDKLSKLIRYAYDCYGNRCVEEMFDGQRQHIYTLLKEYDARGCLLTETNAIGQQATYCYDHAGHCISCIDFGGLRTENTYDVRGRLVTKCQIALDGQTRTTSYAYDLLDRVTEETDYLGHKTLYSYHSQLPKPTRTQRSSESVVSSKYDALGREVFYTDANGGMKITRYNVYGSPIEIVYPDASRVYAHP